MTAIANNADISSKFVVTFWGVSLFTIIGSNFRIWTILYFGDGQGKEWGE